MRTLLFVLLLVPLFVFGQEPATIGKVIAVTGSATIKSDKGEEPLKRGSPIYLHAVIKVGSQSKVQIKFTDSSLMNLIADTEFEVDKYKYKKGNKDNDFEGNLVTGGFKSVSGFISKDNPDQSTVKTPVATIGLRGTVYEIRLINQKIFAGVEKGKLFIETRLGSTEIGEGTGNNFAVAVEDGIPEPLAEMPEELSPEIFTEPEGGLSVDDAQTAIDQGFDPETGLEPVDADNQAEEGPPEEGSEEEATDEESADEESTEESDESSDEEEAIEEESVDQEEGEDTDSGDEMEDLEIPADEGRCV
jgi:hypothetical protein